MLYLSLALLILAVIAGVVGFGGLAAVASDVAKVLFFVFLIASAATLFVRIARRPPLPGARRRRGAAGPQEQPERRT